MLIISDAKVRILKRIFTRTLPFRMCSRAARSELFDTVLTEGDCAIIRVLL